MISKIEISQILNKVNSNNGNEPKSDIFPWDILKFDVTYFFIKRY